MKNFCWEIIQINLLPSLLKKTALEQEKKLKKYEGDHDSATPHSGKPLVKTDEEIMNSQSDSHYMPLKELMKEDLKEAFHKIFEMYK